MNRMISEINLFSPRSDMLNWFLPQDIVKILVTGIFDVGIFKIRKATVTCSFNNVVGKANN
jgi:hypothetical protein